MPFQFFTFNRQKRSTLSKLGWWYMFSKYKEDGRGIRRKIIGNEKNKLKHILYSPVSPPRENGTCNFSLHSFSLLPPPSSVLFKLFFGLENCSSWTVFVLKESVFLYHGGPVGRPRKKHQSNSILRGLLQQVPAITRC